MLKFKGYNLRFTRISRVSPTPLITVTMNLEQLISKYSKLSGQNQAESASAVSYLIQILTDAISNEEDIFTPTMTMKTRRTTPKTSPDGKERKPKTIGKIIVK
jgi:hypothetical protein